MKTSILANIDISFNLSMQRKQDLNKETNNNVSRIERKPLFHFFIIKVLKRNPGTIEINYDPKMFYLHF